MTYHEPVEASEALAPDGRSLFSSLSAADFHVLRQLRTSPDTVTMQLAPLVIMDGTKVAADGSQMSAGSEQPCAAGNARLSDGQAVFEKTKPENPKQDHLTRAHEILLSLKASLAAMRK
jgi:hypothetical protein